MKFKDLIPAVVIASLTILAAPAWAVDDPIVFPSKDQSAEQQEQDEFHCYGWAKGKTSFDPMAIPKTQSAPPKKRAERGGAIRGAFRGAALGVIIDDSSDGAATGAAAGAAMGAMRRSDQRRREEGAKQDWETKEARAYAEKRGRYNRAYAACLEGRGYTVR